MANKNKKTIEYIDESWYYPTIDDWYGNYDRDTVQVRVFAFPNRVGICVTGNDDYGLIINFQTSSWTEAQSVYVEKLFWAKNKFPNPLTKDWLLKQGFKIN